MTPSLLYAEVKAQTIALRLRLLRERRRALRDGWHMPTVAQLVKTPSAFEIPVILPRFLDRSLPTTLVDVGANTGYWAERLRRCIPAEYVAVEPDPRAFAQLQDRFPSASLHHAAAGSAPGKLTLNLAADSVYSSAATYLPDNPIQTDFVATAEVPVITIDSLDVDTRQIIVKIDVQGLEADVIAGGHQLLGRATAAVLEAPLWPTTDNDVDLGTLTSLLHEHGLSPLYFALPGLRAGRFTIPVEYDVVFARR